MRKIATFVICSVAAIGLAAGPAAAAVTFDPASGTGFVGKGDVQLAFGWNNAQLNTNAGGVDFFARTVTEQETTWTCDRDAGPQTQEKENVTTTTTQGIVTKITRDNKKQITGFYLGGYESSATPVIEREGPPTGSCPTNWTAINLVTGDPVVNESESGLFVTYGTSVVEIY